MDCIDRNAAVAPRQRSTHEVKLRCYVDAESELQRWLSAFHKCINCFELAQSKQPARK